jgi:hypothetical protein
MYNLKKEVLKMTKLCQWLMKAWRASVTWCKTKLTAKKEKKDKLPVN